VKTSTDGRRFLGLDLGGTKILGAVHGEGREPLALEQIETRRDDGAPAVAARAVDLARRLARQAGPLAGAGVGFAGLVDAKRGVVDSSIILPGFEGFELAGRFSAALDLPCVADNDATAAGFGELLALDSPPRLDMVLLTLGTGIGGALVVAGKLHRGGASVAGEFGNTTVDRDGPECPSGNRGSLNSLASGAAIGRTAHERARERRDSRLARLPAPITAQQVDAAARAGDELAREILAEAGRALGAGLANFINIVNPDRVALMGGLTGALGYLDAARDEARRRAFARSFGHARIELAVLGGRTGAFGAAALAREQLS
jgi:glucokinase